MAGIQQLIFDLIARDSASPAFAKLGATAQGASGNVSDLSKRIDELGRKSAEARIGLQGNQEAQATLDKLDARLLSLTHKRSIPLSIEGAARAAAEVSALELELDKLGKEGGSAGAATSAVGTGGLAGPSGMGALIAAGVALTPVLITLGTGLAGLGLAAAGTAAPVLKAAQATGGLSANMHKLNPEQQALALSLLGLGQQYHQFQLALQPQVFGVFNQGIKIAGQLMHDVQPVAAATGTAFGTFLGQFGATLQDPQWTQFWAFMAQTAPEDMRLLGGLLIDLTNDLPGLVRGLQPAAQALRTKLALSGGAIGLQTQKQRDSFGAAQAYIKDLGDQATQAVASGKGVDAAMTAIRNGLPLLDSAKTKNHQYWLEVQTLVGWLDKLRAEKAIQESILVSGTGRWSVSNFGMPGGQGHAVGAAGMLVSGGIAGRDSRLIMAMPGEALVPTRLVPMLAPFLRAQGVPGFAARGGGGPHAGNGAG